MKILFLVLLIFSITACNNSKKQFGVHLNTVDNNSSALALTEMPPEKCRIAANNVLCRFDPKTHIKWGTGFCQSSKESLVYEKSLTKIEFFINRQLIPAKYITAKDETYPDDAFPFCTSWLVELKDWEVGKSYRLETKNKGRLIEEANLTISKDI